MKKTFLGFLVVASVAAIPAQAQLFRPSVVNGALLGGVAGAIIGNNAGHGGHTGEGAAIGVVAGALLGAAIDNHNNAQAPHEVPRPAPVYAPAPVVYAPAQPAPVVYVPSAPAPVVYQQPTTIVYQTQPSVVYAPQPVYYAPPPPRVVYYAPAYCPPPPRASVVISYGGHRGYDPCGPAYRGGRWR